MAQEAGTKNRHWRTGKCRNLSTRGACNYFGFGVEQDRRVEDQDALFIRHSIATVTTCRGGSA